MLKRGRIEVKRGGRGTGTGENPVIVLENGLLPFDQQDKENLSLADILAEQYQGNELAMIEDGWGKYTRRDLPEADQLPTFWSIFWTKHPEKLVKPAYVKKSKVDGVETETTVTAAEATANARKSFAASIATLAKMQDADLAETAETAIAGVK